MVAVAASTREGTDGAAPIIAPHGLNRRLFDHGPAVVPYSALQVSPTFASAPVIQQQSATIDDPVSEPVPVGRLATRLCATTAAFNPILVALHEVEGGHRLLARLGALDPEEAERLHDGITALLASHGIHNAAVTIVTAQPISSN
jgi:hypothetical protein